ncbi:hypothetical protein AAHB33_10755 [Paenarthrobacter sp. S56]|uniref:hypothetical protein n=1 Tax=Paenarthrobacter sp. S56 TaxID=3138179 RepID=UPI00321B677B
MPGNPARHLIGIAILAALLAGCTPAADLGAAPSTPGLASPSPVSPGATKQATETAPLPAEQAAGVPQPTVTPSAAAAPAPPLQPFAFDLYEDGDFVPQYTFDWCVAASIQMAHNLIQRSGSGVGTWAGRDQQSDLWNMARARSSDAFNGANPFGWAAVLTEAGLGPYKVVSVPDYEAALRSAASAMAVTGRPVGLVMWSGRHAWVMSGFESEGDPPADQRLRRYRRSCP